MDQLISPDMLDLQRDLHARYDYGRGVDAPECLDLMLRLLGEGATVLDYGAGRGHFARVTGERLQVSEYDPAVSGKDAPPRPAQGVVCADVLEHVEERNIPAVLRHIRDCTLSFAILIIATGPSSKIMADGRHAHVTLRDLEWWRLAISRWMLIEREEDRSEEGRGLLFVCRQPRRTVSDGKDFVEIGRVRAICAVGEEDRNALVLENTSRCAKRVMANDGLEKLPDNRRLATLVCYGPSLADSWEELQLEPDADVFSCSGAHRFLIERGIVPQFHLECDPRPHKATQLGDPDARVKYWLASCVSRELMDKLDGFDVSLWHAYNGESSHKLVSDIEPHQRLVVGGGSIGLRALSLLYYLGYRDIAVHGLDCSFKDGQQHAGAHDGKAMQSINVLCNDRVFQTSLALVTYFRNFYEMMTVMPDVQITLKGDGLLQHALRSSYDPAQ